MSPTSSSTFLVGKYSRSAALRTISAEPLLGWSDDADQLYDMHLPSTTPTGIVARS
jgi:hypothetical protein